jgi:hypothetical protein
MTPSMGGVTLSYTQNTADVKEDGFGDTAISQVSVGGANPTLTVVMSEVESARLQKIVGVTLSTAEHAFKCDNGTDLRALAKPIYVKPVENGTATSTKSEWLHIFLATPPVVELTNTYDDTSQRIVQVKFTALPATSTGNTRKLFAFGVN